MGPVPQSNYLLNANTFDNIFAGGSQSTTPAPYKVNNPNIYISQAPEYYPVKSVTGFGKSTALRRDVGKKNKLVKPVKAKKEKIKLVRSEKENKQKKSGEPKIKEGSVISVNKFGKIKVH